MDVAIRPLSPLGAEVTGIDLRDPFSDDLKRRLREAWHRHALLLFRGQELTQEDQLRAVTLFGDVSDQGEAPGGVCYVTNLAQRGVAQSGEMNVYSVGELKFHFDHSFHEVPLRGAMLYAIEVPPPESGGDTLFADSRLAYRLLPGSLRARIAPLKIRHEVRTRATPDAAVHPLAFTHPATGEKILFLSRRHADRILGLSPAESEALMDELSSYIERPEIILRHVWHPRDLVVWDNLALQHARTEYDPSRRRHLRRTQIG